MIICAMEYYTGTIKSVIKPYQHGKIPKTCYWVKTTKYNHVEHQYDSMESFIFLFFIFWNHLWAKMQTLYISIGTCIYMECTEKDLQYTKMLTVIISWESLGFGRMVKKDLNLFNYWLYYLIIFEFF